ncbi:SDR family oxidoreductase [Halarsenatibacter silvermanii]|uniref:NAD(P)-dependent dehydrogenase, short-chain alcohol dehydrogenase family n=1 Tax=Halarsenatibacter silvermanii TaxID=321763 RepID=A0A1G9LUS1_9FIRM|nr:SDR family oxidoreductase [Halarsenatibacter silvermanii]SDL65678.1 NAD(P)-dependent dehydrogenase, short-chain alcohol dehydrogenase family [Halarsenatibacter silvermanii]
MSNLFDDFRLEGKTALVTGAARGLGKAMAEGLMEAGADLVIPDIEIEKARETAEILRERWEGGVLVTKTDVTDKNAVKEMTDKTLKEFNSLDILVNNAGIVINKPAEEMSFEEWKRVIDVNLNGVYLCSREAARPMIEQESGSIINIASMSAKIVNNPQPQASYNASKAGVEHLTRSLAAEWAEYNIRVNCISPGYMRTEITKKFEDKDYVQDKWIEPTPMKRMGEPEELKGAAVYLASEASSFMTGHSLVIDGGYTIY